MNTEKKTETEMKTEKKKSLVYRILRAAVKTVYRAPVFEGMENLPEGPFILVGNHTQMNGPLISELYLPGKHYTWCAAQMMHPKEVPDYAYRDFWCEKPAAVRPFFRLASYLIVPLCMVLFSNADCIGVYRDSRILKTLKETVSVLRDGAAVVIFPECAEKYNHIVCRFQDGFVDVAALYAKKEGKSLPFVPMYIAPSLKKAVFGKPVLYDAASERQQERTRITEELMDRITKLALELPPHVVTPYSNVSKKQYPMSR